MNGVNCIMRRAFFIALLFVTHHIIAQNEDVVGYFNSAELNGKVLLTWNIKQGNTCNGVKIEHSIDSLNFTEVGSIEGVCGSASANTPYEFTHQTPVMNAVNYYRLWLGGIGYSWIISEKIIGINENGFTIAPHPITEASVLYLENSNNAEYTMTVYSLSGAKVHSSEINSNEINLGEIGFESGFHYFEIMNKGTSTTIRGKFLVP